MGEHRDHMSLHTVRCAVLVALTLVGPPAARAASENEPTYTRTVATYDVPDVTLTNQHGAKVNLRALLLQDKPVVLNFIFTTCNTICPLMSSSFAAFQKQLGPAAHDVQLVSISIDPEFDTPQEANAFLKRFGAAPGWDFLIASRPDTDRVLKAFDAYTQNKMNHNPLVLMKMPGATTWLRINGMVGGGILAQELAALRR